MKISMQEAYEKAAEKKYKFLSKDYHALSSDEKDELRNLMNQTVFTQSASSKAAGRTKIYQFYLGLWSKHNRKANKKKKATPKNKGMRGVRKTYKLKTSAVIKVSGIVMVEAGSKEEAIMLAKQDFGTLSFENPMNTGSSIEDWDLSEDDSTIKFS